MQNAIQDLKDGPTEIVRRTEPDLVVMDIQIDGLVDTMLLAKEIRYDFGKPIIFLTDLADEKTIKRAGEIDPEAYLLKPFDENELKSSVAIAMSRNRSREALINREKQLFSTLTFTLPNCLNTILRNRFVRRV